MMSALAECGTIKTVSQARARMEATKYSPDRPTLSVALGMGYLSGYCAKNFSFLVLSSASLVGVAPITLDPLKVGAYADLNCSFIL